MNNKLKPFYTIKQLGEAQLLKKKNGTPYEASYVRGLIDQGKLKSTLVEGIAHIITKEAIEEFNKRK